MPQNFIACDRDQELLLPPNLREWLPEDHLAWFVLATTEEMDLSAFYGAYRGDGHGRAAREPGMMVSPGGVREAKRCLDEKRAAEAKPIPRSHPERLSQSKRWLEEEALAEETTVTALSALAITGP